MLAAYIFLFAAIAVYPEVLAQEGGTPNVENSAPHSGNPLMGHSRPQHRSDPYHHHHYTEWPPRPYAFSYNALLHDHVHPHSKMSRTETQDETGRVQGSYSLNAEGYSRIVDYVADHNGFRAHVRTNEPGTLNENPANVIMESTYHGHHTDGGVGTYGELSTRGGHHNNGGVGTFGELSTRGGHLTHGGDGTYGELSTRGGHHTHGGNGTYGELSTRGGHHTYGGHHTHGGHHTRGGHHGRNDHGNIHH